jgi:hypothetical protein
MEDTGLPFPRRQDLAVDLALVVPPGAFPDLRMALDVRLAQRLDAVTLGLFCDSLGGHCSALGGLALRPGVAPARTWLPTWKMISLNIG